MSAIPIPDPMLTKTVTFTLDELVILGRAIEVRLAELERTRAEAVKFCPALIPHWESRIADTRAVHEKLEKTPWRFKND